MTKYLKTIYRAKEEVYVAVATYGDTEVTIKRKVRVFEPCLSFDLPLLVQDLKEAAQTLIAKGLRALGAIAKSYAQSVINAPSSAYVQC